METKSAKLIPIDLKKGEGHNHPDITLKKIYLAKIGSCYYAGKFSEEWYGLNFECNSTDFGCGIQYDKPGANSSRWKKLWEISV